MVHIGSDSLFHASLGTGETNIYTSLTDGNFQVTRKPEMPIAGGSDEGTYGNTLVNWKDKFIFSLGGMFHFTSTGKCAFFDLEHDEWHALDNELRNNSQNLSNHGVTRPGAMILGDKLYAYNGEANWDTCNGYNDVDEPSYVLKSIQLTDNVKQLKKAKWTKFQWGPPDLLNKKHFLMAPLNPDQVFIYFKGDEKQIIIFDVARNEILDQRPMNDVDSDDNRFSRCFPVTQGEVVMLSNNLTTIVTYKVGGQLDITRRN